MTTREEFVKMVVEHGIYRHRSAAIMAAWDALAAERDALRAEVHRVGVPLTAENADRARVVEDVYGVWVHDGGNCFDHASSGDFDKAPALIARGATVLAWRKP